MNSHKHLLDRRNSAHFLCGCISVLDFVTKCTNVRVVSGDFIPASFADYLFRTPSLNGQAFTTSDCLPVSLFQGQEDAREDAESGDCGDCALHRSSHRSWVCLSSTKKQKGLWTCRAFSKLQPCYLFARASLPVETPQANRRSMVRGPGSSALRRWIPTSTRARRPERRPTFSTATKNRALATDRYAGVGADLSLRHDSSRTTKAPFFRLAAAKWRTNPMYATQRATTSLTARGGFSRSTSIQTKDTRCSVRS